MKEIYKIHLRDNNNLLTLLNQITKEKYWIEFWSNKYDVQYQYEKSCIKNL